MARLRLGPARPDFLDPAGHPAGAPAAGPAPGAVAPIARAAGEAAAEAAFAEVSRALREAREEGRLVLVLPLGEIDEGHLVRDRLAADPEEMAALVESIRAHGQRMPVEVTPLPGAARPWGLISGSRRLAALRALHAETGEARFATIRALPRPAGEAAASYVTMVEENEIRAGLSYYERARVAAVTADLGVFPDERAALSALFARASRARRSKIGSFLAVYRALDGHLRFPAAIPERLGLRLAERLRAPDGAGALRAALAAAPPAATPEAERATLAAALRPAPAVPEPAGDGSAAPSPLRPGVWLEVRRGAESLTLRLRGPGVDDALAARLAALLDGLAEDPG